jgi:hypothetical protein
LGAKYVVDERALNYLMAAEFPATATIQTSPFYDPGPTLNQGQEGACVLFAWAHKINAGPRVPATLLTDEDAFRFYPEAQAIDEFADTPPEEGTSNQAGAKIYRGYGYIERFVWARTLDDVKLWMRMNKGPVVMTMRWFDGMYEPDRYNFIYPTGPLVGGHAILCIGFYVLHDGNTIWIFQNSWGTDYGDGGIVYMHDRTMRELSYLSGWTGCSSTEPKAA